MIKRMTEMTEAEQIIESIARYATDSALYKERIEAARKESNARIRVSWCASLNCYVTIPED